MITAQLLVKCLEAHGVEYVFGIPGAKVDTIFDALEDSSIKLILCRHEQNATFMAAAYGRLTEEPGVVLVTSGPGVGNLCTGLLTATTEGDPVVAIGGNVERSMIHKSSHQSAQNVKMMEAVTKSSKEIYASSNVPEAVANAFRLAKEPTSGACFLSFPQDVLKEATTSQVVKPAEISFERRACNAVIEQTAHLINSAKNPVVLLGQEASRVNNTEAVRKLLSAHALPVVSTYQAAGVISESLLHCFYGRVGLFKNQPGDKLLDQADLVITVGYNPAEYDPEIWNAKANKKIIHVDEVISDIHFTYQTEIEVLGSIERNLNALSLLLKDLPLLDQYQVIQDSFKKNLSLPDTKKAAPGKLHPLEFIESLKPYVDDNTIVSCDIGSLYMWMSRYFLSHVPHQLLFSNGQQTLGVGLPWGMAAKMACPEKRVISMSGDGGFLFSSMELETAVRENLHLIHFVWVDGTYNMVKEQEVMKYDRGSGVEFGQVDVVKYAEAFGAEGYRLSDVNQFDEIMKKALTAKGPVLIEMPVDYSDNPSLFETVNKNGH